MKRGTPACEPAKWKGRDATRLTNGVIELITLTGGGHLADLRLLAHNTHRSDNAMWEAPWVTCDPGGPQWELLSRKYGAPEIGRFLACYTGHALCLDNFGAPSAAEAAEGLSLHGEAAVAHWNVIPCEDTRTAGCRWKVGLPYARLTFEREIRLRDGESVAYVQETVTNQRTEEHGFDWVHHVTLGPPVLQGGESTLAISAQRGITSPFPYDTSSLLADNREFCWPFAPKADGGFEDLRKAFPTKGYGFVTALQLDRKLQAQYLVVANWKRRLAVGYCFRYSDFPWMTIWKENRARQDAPWNGKTQACGLEFGSTPLPLGQEETVRRGPLFDVPSWCTLPAHGKKTARYLIFLSDIPSRVEAIKSVAAIGDEIVLSSEPGGSFLSIAAKGCEEFLSSAMLRNKSF